MTITIKFYIEAARARGWQVEWIDEERNVIAFHAPQQEPILIRNNVTELATAIGSLVSSYKSVTTTLAAKVGFLVPKTLVIEEMESYDKALPLLAETKRIVVKPMDAAFGNGVSTNVTSAAELEQAVTLARKHNVKSGAIVVQEFCEGRDYRVLVLNDKVIAAIERVPLLVVGNGKQTVAELLTTKVALLQAQEANQIKPVEIDSEAILSQLSGQTADKILPQNEQLIIQGVANLSKGGEAIDVTDQVHPDIARKSFALARLLRMDMCAVDVLSQDIAKDPSEAKTTFIEMNIAPGFRGHYFPAVGQRHDVAGMILDAIIEKRKREVL